MADDEFVTQAVQGAEDIRADARIFRNPRLAGTGAGAEAISDASRRLAGGASWRMLASTRMLLL
jgi:hypothetical protein